jgi:hypothetical protein
MGTFVGLDVSLRLIEEVHINGQFWVLTDFHYPPAGKMQMEGWLQSRDQGTHDNVLIMGFAHPSLPERPVAAATERCLPGSAGDHDLTPDHPQPY